MGKGARSGEKTAARRAVEPGGCLANYLTIALKKGGGLAKNAQIFAARSALSKYRFLLELSPPQSTMPQNAPFSN